MALGERYEAGVVDIHLAVFLAIEWEFKWQVYCYIVVEHGLPRFDFMGAGKPEEDYGVRAFKAQMGGQLVGHGRFLLIAKPLLYRIGVLGVAWLRRKR